MTVDTATRISGAVLVIMTITSEIDLRVIATRTQTAGTRRAMLADN
jgi:hypothetical protein